MDNISHDLDNISYNPNEGTVSYTIPSDTDTAMVQYKSVPIVRSFVQREIQVKCRALYNIERTNFSGYEITGFFYTHSGEKFELTMEEFGVVE